MFQGQNNVTGEEASGGLIEALTILKMEEQFAAGTVVEYHEQLALVLKGEVHFNYVRMVNFFLS